MDHKTLEFSVDNIKCGGCASTITSRLNALDGVSDATVNVDAGTVSVRATPDHRVQVSGALLDMGYPETGSAEGLASMKAKAKSFVSCAVGRIAGASDASG